MARSVDQLARYLSRGGLKGSMELTFKETEEIDHHVVHWRGQDLPWHGPTCLAVLSYVIKFQHTDLYHGTLSDTIRRLNDSASKYDRAQWKLADDYGSPERWVWEETVQEMNQEIVEMFVNSFMPELQIFFNIPKLQNLDKSLKPNETLAGFMDFLLQILNAEANITWKEKQKFGLLRNELTFLLTFLGDTPFQRFELEEVNNLLEGYEMVANEVGDFIYSFVFSTCPIRASRFNAAKDALLEKVELLNSRIKGYCMNYSELESFVVPRANVVDSLFIFDSLLEDVESILNRHSTDGDLKQHINSLFCELMLSKSLLQDIKAPQYTQIDEIKDYRIQIRDMAYEAEYLINSYVVGNIPIWYLNIRLPAVISKIKVIGTRLQEIMKTYGTKSLKVMEKFMDNATSTDMVTSTAEIDDIGNDFSDTRTRIVDDLIGRERKQQIISIFGMPGLGKTTMAKMLYNHASIYYHFDERAWCVVSQTYQRRKVLIDILMSMSCRPEKNDILTMDEESLGLKIHQGLIGRRYLIIIDDVWYSNTLDDLRRFFPDDSKGSRIMLTSRIKDTAPADSIFHTLPLLSEVQCWELLVKKIFGKEPCPPELCDTGERIATKCQGLPLAVVVVAGILAESRIETDWKKVERDLSSQVLGDPVGYEKILELSYEHLPDHLKPCFLYFGTFPEDGEISVRKLTWLWIAEGFIQRKEDKSPEDVAESYLFDLINRSLVVVAQRKSDGGIKACGIHDLLRDLCLKRAHAENFLKSAKENLSVYEPYHRLCFSVGSSDYWTAFGLHCRSLLGHLAASSSRFQQMPLLRVMDLSPTWVLHQVEKFGFPPRLRYLSFDKIPKPIADNFLNLEFLCIEGHVCYISSSILEMVSLRHLRIRNLGRLERYFNSSRTNNLKSLSVVEINNENDEKILRCSPHLLKLKCKCDEKLFPDFGSLSEIESLKIDFEKPFKGALIKVNFPLTIKKLNLRGIGLPWENMSIIGILPNLHVLKVGHNAFVGEEWRTSYGEFEELRLLELVNIDCEQWITESDHFPNLQRLMIASCHELQEIPSELGDIPTLETIEVHNCGYHAGLSAVQIEEEQRKCGNEALNIIVTNYRLSWSKEQLLLKCREIQEQQDNNKNED